jgi:hypothetical protein
MQDIKEVILEVREDVKEIKKEVAEVGKTLIRNTVSLEIHEKRTTQAEERITNIERWQLGLLTAILLTVVGAIIKGAIG